MTKDEIIGNALGIAGLIALPIILGVSICLDRRRVEARAIRQAREGEERGRGIPYTDIERACRHWDITPEQYLSCPDCYPLPARGYGL